MHNAYTGNVCILVSHQCFIVYESPYECFIKNRNATQPLLFASAVAFEKPAEFIIKSYWQRSRVKIPAIHPTTTKKTLLFMYLLYLHITSILQSTRIILFVGDHSFLIVLNFCAIWLRLPTREGCF